MSESHTARGKRRAYANRKKSHRTVRLAPVYAVFIMSQKFQAQSVSVTSILQKQMIMLVNIVSYDVCNFIFQ